jgi:hypothetical protein
VQKYSQYLAEALIPLMGYYIWNWGWYFILLFVILDAFAKEVVLHLKSNKIYQTQGGSQSISVWKKQGLKSAAISLSILLMVHGVYYIHRINVDFLAEIKSFFAYKELGIPQGWVLVPLVFLNVWVQYKFAFLNVGLHTKTQISLLWQLHFKYKIFVFILVLVASLIHTLFHLSDAVLVWITILLPIVYMLITKRRD